MAKFKFFPVTNYSNLSWFNDTYNLNLHGSNKIGSVYGVELNDSLLLGFTKNWTQRSKMILAVLQKNETEQETNSLKFVVSFPTKKYLQVTKELKIRVPDELHLKLLAESKTKKIPMSQIVAKLVDEHFKHKSFNIHGGCNFKPSRS